MSAGAAIGDAGRPRRRGRPVVLATCILVISASCAALSAPSHQLDSRSARALQASSGVGLTVLNPQTTSGITTFGSANGVLSSDGNVLAGGGFTELSDPTTEPVGHTLVWNTDTFTAIPGPVWKFGSDPGYLLANGKGVLTAPLTPTSDTPPQTSTHHLDRFDVATGTSTTLGDLGGDSRVGWFIVDASDDGSTVGISDKCLPGYDADCQPPTGLPPTLSLRTNFFRGGTVEAVNLGIGGVETSADMGVDLVLNQAGRSKISPDGSYVVFAERSFLGHVADDWRTSTAPVAVTYTLRRYDFTSKAITTLFSHQALEPLATSHMDVPIAVMTDGRVFFQAHSGGSSSLTLNELSTSHTTSAVVASVSWDAGHLDSLADSRFFAASADGTKAAYFDQEGGLGTTGPVSAVMLDLGTHAAPVVVSRAFDSLNLFGLFGTSPAIAVANDGLVAFGSNLLDLVPDTPTQPASFNTFVWKGGALPVCPDGAPHPTANDLSVSATPGQLITGQLTAAAPAGESPELTWNLIYQNFATRTHLFTWGGDGTFSLTPPSPADNYFTYSVTDAAGCTSNVATVSITTTAPATTTTPAPSTTVPSPECPAGAPRPVAASQDLTAVVGQPLDGHLSATSRVSGDSTLRWKVLGQSFRAKGMKFRWGIRGSSLPSGIDGGDGTYGVTPSGNKALTFTYSVIDSLGCESDPATVRIRLGAVTAQLSGHPNIGVAPTPVTLDALGSSAAPGTVIRDYTFGFDDGQVASATTSRTVIHEYQSGGEYVASVIVTDSRGRTGKAMVTLNMSEGLSPQSIDVRYNEVRQKSSHNSYERDELIEDQLGAPNRIRAIEFDVHPKQDTGKFDVYHGQQVGKSRCATLRDCLNILSTWDSRNPNHEVVTVWIDADAEVAVVSGAGWGDKDGQRPQDFDKIVREQLDTSYTYYGASTSKLFTPMDLIRSCPSTAKRDADQSYLRSHPGLITTAVTTKGCGWPRLSALRGKFIFVFAAGGASGSHSYEPYLSADPDHSMLNVGKQSETQNPSLAPSVGFVAASRPTNITNAKLFYNFSSAPEGSCWHWEANSLGIVRHVSDNQCQMNAVRALTKKATNVNPYIILRSYPQENGTASATVNDSKETFLKLKEFGVQQIGTNKINTKTSTWAETLGGCDGLWPFEALGKSSPSYAHSDLGLNLSSCN